MSESEEKAVRERMGAGYFLGWSFFRIYSFLYHRRKVFNRERVPMEGGVIIAANHLSFLDPIFVGSSTKRVIHYLARESAFNSKIGGAILRSWNSIPVDRDGGGAKGLRMILQRLKEGGAIMMFPEGTRSPDGTPQPARPGIGLMIGKSTAPVLPVRIFGSYEAYGRHLKFPRPKKVKVKFGEPMDFKELREEAKKSSPDRRKEVYEEMAVELMDTINGMEPVSD